MPDSPLPSILIVDHDETRMQALCDTLREHGYDPLGFYDSQAALDALRERKFDLLLADLVMPGADGILMPGLDGLTLLREAQVADVDLVCIIMADEGTIASAVAAMKIGAVDYVLKPFQLELILLVLARAMAVRGLRVANALLAREAQEHTAKLEAANMELEAFAFSVSHDLRSPLTVIMASAESLLEDYAASLPEAARQTLRDIMAGVDRMTHLTSDLLRLSMLSREPIAAGLVDMQALVRETVEELRYEWTSRTVDIRIGDLLASFGDRALLKQVFVNLLSNAFKFTRNRDRAVVEVSSEREADGTVFSVRDNGAGFDLNVSPHLFGAFQRFHTVAEFEGTGVGLSIVKRIVERHGGRVWAESRPDEGAVFRFSLPAPVALAVAC
ncbi:MAG: ATP-binding protein [Reyranellaceae bacterium]